MAAHQHQSAIFKCKSGRWDSNPRPSPWQGDVLPLNYARMWPWFPAESAETQDRTGDTAIFSRVLYQLSYLGLRSLSEREDFTILGKIVKKSPGRLQGISKVASKNPDDGHKGRKIL